MASKKGKTTSGPSSVGKTHRAFQPVLPCGNKLLQQKWDQTYYDDHKKLVKSARPMVDSKPPSARPHVVSKLKKQQLEKERLEEIDRDNMTLLTKMQRIMKTGDRCVDNHCTSHQYRHSLNQEKRQREVRRVASENRQMLTRLQNAEPIYKVSNWIDDWQRKEELTNMITAYPADMIPVANKIKESVAMENSGSEEAPVQIVDCGSKEQNEQGKESNAEQ